jgi:hypothetical protein
MQDEGSTFSFKDLMTMVPLGAIILAALFDFGSFNAVDKSLFTLFSWSDHIVFALEAVFPAIVIVAAIGWSLSKYTLDVPLKLQPRGRLWFLVVLFASLTLMVILSNGYVGVTVFWALMGLITLGAIFFTVRLAGLVVAYALGLLFGAFVLGLANGYSALSMRPEQSLFMTTGGEMRGRVFRTGERGLLFHDTTTKKLNFLLWNEVKRLETAVPDATSGSGH